DYYCGSYVGSNTFSF
nr:immunoglobulin light chain junction region [Macaca mulatta]MOW06772.1 immunoglobulin light chain junction region [Macaca mulatta]